MTPPETRWTSWHVHLASDARALHDRVLTDVIGPVVGALDGRPWFFMRYWQAGPHLRLRIGNLSSRSSGLVEGALRERLAAAGSLTGDERPLDDAAYRSGATLFAATERGADREVRDLRKPGVYRSTYEPEYARYGGRALMPQTERLFQLSSDVVLALMAQLTTAAARTRVALRGTMSAGAALGDTAEQATFYALGTAAWRAWAADAGCAEDQLHQLCSFPREPGTGGLDPTAHGPFRDWHAALGALTAEIRRTSTTPPGQIVFSHVHMLHNRLGRSLFDELRTYAWLAHVFPDGVPAATARPTDGMWKR